MLERLCPVAAAESARVAFVVVVVDNAEQNRDEGGGCGGECEHESFQLFHGCASTLSPEETDFWMEKMTMMTSLTQTKRNEKTGNAMTTTMTQNGTFSFSWGAHRGMSVTVSQAVLVRDDGHDTTTVMKHSTI